MKFEVGDLFRFDQPIGSLELASVVIPGRGSLESVWLVREGNEEKSFWTLNVHYAFANKSTGAVELYGEMWTNLNDDKAIVCFRSDLKMKADYSFFGTVHIITPEALQKILKQ